MVIEHNLDVIKTADYIIDIGPEGGDKGGTVIAKGTPEEVARCPVSYTGMYVKEISELTTVMTAECGRERPERGGDEVVPPF